MKFVFATIIAISVMQNLAFAADRTPVIVELFTSEGCSSCPAADELLAKLVKDQPIDGAQIIALAFHVDYWNNLGWPDRFSSAEFSKRQSQYGNGRVYTPQMIVDGAREFVGSNSRMARSEISTAAKNSKPALDVAVKHIDKKEIQVQVSFAQPLRLREGQSADVLIALTEDDLTSDVKRGENAGRQLHHAAVVRQLNSIATLSASSESRPIGASIRLQDGWDARKLKVVALVQDRATRQMLAAGQISAAQ